MLKKQFKKNMAKEINKKIKKAFVKTFVMVLVFFILIIFSIEFFNSEQRSLSEIPFVDDTFQIIVNISDWIDENINQRIDLMNIFGRR